MSSFTRFLCAGICATFFSLRAQAQSDPLVSKAITQVFANSDQVFAFNDTGTAFSRLGLFTGPPTVGNGVWPYPPGVAEGGVIWRTSLLLRSNPFISDTVRVARVASLYYDGKSWKDDSLILPVPLGASNSLAQSASFTAMAVWHDSLILGFGKLGVGIVGLAPENGVPLLTTPTISFSGFPSNRDSLLAVTTCTWNATCRVDTLHAPAAGLDSVIDLAVDSSSADSIWLLIATSSGLRRGLLGGTAFPHAALPGLSDTSQVAVQKLAASPAHNLLWAFTGAHFFFSGDHGNSFHVPPTVAGLTTTPAVLTGYGAPPQVATFGDSSFINFYLTRPGLVLFQHDSLQWNGVGTKTSEISDVLIDAADSLNITQGEGSLTELCIARSNGDAVLAVGSTDEGLFYRQLNGSGKTFSNLNRYRSLQGSLGQIITYPTLLTGATAANGQPEVVHIGYRLNKSGKVTITVYNYAMEKVRVIVKNAPRQGGQARSENLLEDRWDGRDASGRSVSVGTYYILVESDQGERGWGKAICAQGRQ